MNNHTSSFIFSLVEEFQLLNANNENLTISDEAFNQFSAKYKLQSEGRDNALKQYLSIYPNSFRVHLPFTNRTLTIAANIVWYYDELIINDPILLLINMSHWDLNYKKEQLTTILNSLNELKDCILGGYILFAGEFAPTHTGRFVADSKAIISNPDVLNAFEKLTAIGKKEPLGPHSPIQLATSYNSLMGRATNMGQYIPEPLLNERITEVIYDFQSPYLPMEKEELERLGKIELLKGLQETYCEDIAIILEALANSSILNVPTFFHRDVDVAVAQNYSSPDINSSVDNGALYRFLLPYINNIPENRLFDVRNQMPESFMNFRLFFYDAIKTAMAKTTNPAEIKFEIDKKVIPQIQCLEVELRNIDRKWNIQGLTIPAVVVAGSLSMFFSGIDSAGLVTTIFGGSGALTKGLHAWNEKKNSQRNATLNPGYFLWKAHNS